MSELEEGATLIAHKVDEQMVVLMDPMEDPDDILRAHRSREKSYLFDVAFDFTATQVRGERGLGTHENKTSPHFALQGQSSGDLLTLLQHLLKHPLPRALPICERFACNASLLHFCTARCHVTACPYNCRAAQRASCRSTLG